MNVERYASAEGSHPTPFLRALVRLLPVSSELLTTHGYQFRPEVHWSPSNYLKIDSHDSSLIGKKWNGSAWEEIPVSAEEKEKDGRDWRDVELLRTDSLMLLDDYPQKDNLAAYRQKLRDWPSTGDFPATKPTL